MSIVKVQGNASGTGIFTVASPNSNTDRTLTLPDATGTVQVSGQPVSATTGTFSGTISGGSTIGVGGATPSASGAGITFPASQSASTDANTLDDYEEGTWTPVATVQGGATGSYVTQVGRYTKVGNIVRVGFSIRVNKGTATGSLTISGLPFAFSGGGDQRGLASIDWFVPSGTAIVNCTAFGTNGTTILRVTPIVAANVDATSTDFLWSYVATTVDISGSLVYQA